ncbi:GH25 family lysozyme [Streptosporangium lutulentum]
MEGTGEEGHRARRLPLRSPRRQSDHRGRLLPLGGELAAAKPGDLLVLDLETTDGRSVSEVNAWAKAWLARVQAKTGVKPMVYSSWNFANTYGAGLSQYPLWVAYYGVPMGDVPPPADWKTWTIHQYTETPIDQDVSSLTPDQLRSLGRPPTA